MSDPRVRFVRLFTIAVAVVFAAGTGLVRAAEETAEAPPEQEIPSLQAYDNVYVVVKGTDEVVSDKKFKKASGWLQQWLMDKLEKPRAFESVSAGEPEAGGGSDLVINMLVNEFAYTGQTGRIMGGVMAGKAKLGMVVTLKPGDSGESLAELSMSTTSKTSHGVFGASTQKQIEGMTRQIAEKVLAKKQ